MMKTLSQLPAKFMAMSMPQRFGLLAVSAMAVAVVVVGLMWATAPKYQYLFTDLNEQDASLVVQHLKDGRISYRLAKGGTAIMARKRSRDTYRSTASRRSRKASRWAGSMTPDS